MVNQLQSRLPALKSWQWDRNWEIEISRVYETLQSNSNALPRDYRGIMNAKPVLLRIWSSSLEDCLTTWSTSGLTYHILSEKGDRSQVWKILPSLSNDRLQLRMIQDLQVLLPCQPLRQDQPRKNHPTEQMSLLIQGRPYPLLLISPPKTLAEDQEQVMDRVSPHPEYRAVCFA